MTVVIEKPPTVLPEITEMHVLCKAADIMEQRGYTQGIMYRHGRVCAIGAIDLALKSYGYEEGDGNDRTYYSFLQAARVRLSRIISYMTGQAVEPEEIEDWNDALPRGKGKQVVTSMLRMAGDCIAEL